MAVAEAQAPVPGDPRGEAMVAELKWVHNMIRRDLRTVRQMAADAAAGRAARSSGPQRVARTIQGTTITGQFACRDSQPGTEPAT